MQINFFVSYGSADSPQVSCCMSPGSGVVQVTGSVLRCIFLGRNASYIHSFLYFGFKKPSANRKYQTGFVQKAYARTNYFNRNICLCLEISSA